MRQVRIGPFSVVKGGGFGIGRIAQLKFPVPVEIAAQAEIGGMGRQGQGGQQHG